MQTATIPLHGPLLRGERRARVALVGRRRTGKSSIFQAASSPAVKHERLAGVGGSYEECLVDVGLDQISLVDLPDIETLHHLREHDRVVLMYLLWGDRWPDIARHESEQPVAAFPAPDVLIQVMDATMLDRDLELSMELSLLGRPMVIALNRMDEARAKGIFINIRALSEKLGVPVVPTVAHMGKGIRALFDAAVKAARNRICPLPQPASPHLVESLQALNATVARPEVIDAFQVPRPLLLCQLAENDDYFLNELGCHFPELLPEVVAARGAAERGLPRTLSEEIHADRHHRAALLLESVSSPSGAEEEGWKRWLDGLFLHPRWGLLGSLAVFALVLFVTFEVSATLDSLTSARLVAWSQTWQPDSTTGIVTQAVVDGLIGLVGIVVPYMIPLVLLLVALEESGIMHRVAFVVDRGFHHIGLHGGVAVPFLIGLGCNVPAISAAAAASSGRDRLIAALLITFVPCSARSAIILALGGKYLGGFGVFGIFMLTLVVIAVLGKILAQHFSEAAPGMIQEIPAYALPKWHDILRKTWGRTSDIVTIVTPLLIIGSIVLALLSHWGADAFINTALTPVTSWWLGLPVVLGVPILFGVLRKELSLLMVYQALGTQEIVPLLDWVQIVTFLIFLTFYVPCLSTFAVMLRALGRKEALFSIALSVGIALLSAGIIRVALSAVNALW
ncbi:MAG: ferrous iron transporter B [Gammaproteobacteria bacterium]|nr:ferrous iron transporter B [Gammaproteobacteria bacterium]MBU1414222.1 ferrous iron transporter B [Gammaproteobacteria bacterium]